MQLVEEQIDVLETKLLRTQAQLELAIQADSEPLRRAEIKLAIGLLKECINIIKEK